MLQSQVVTKSTKTVSRPVRMSYSEAKEHFASQ
jgi:hypothetical protein